MNNKRIIIVGPTCSGKTFLRKRFEERGFTFDISYTTRKPREGEVNGVHYHFVSENEFKYKIEKNYFKEYITYAGSYYGTGEYEWNKCDCFIMETDGVKKISKEERKKCFIIYLNTPLKVRKERLKKERKWNKKEINKRVKQDKIKFKDFNDYDLLITNADF